MSNFNFCCCYGGGSRRGGAFGGAEEPEGGRFIFYSYTSALVTRGLIQKCGLLETTKYRGVRYITINIKGGGLLSMPKMDTGRNGDSWLRIE